MLNKCMEMHVSSNIRAVPVWVRQMDCRKNTLVPTVEILVGIQLVRQRLEVQTLFGIGNRSSPIRSFPTPSTRNYRPGGGRSVQSVLIPADRKRSCLST